MPHILNKTIISEGTQKAVVHFYIESDGSPELNYEPLWDPAKDFANPMLPDRLSDTGLKRLPRVAITQVWYNQAPGITFTLSFDGTPPNSQMVLAGGIDSYIDFRSFAGIRDFTITNVNLPTQGSITVVGGNTASANRLAAPSDNVYPPVNSQTSFTGDEQDATIVPGSGRLLLTSNGLATPTSSNAIGPSGLSNAFFILEMRKYLA